MLLKDARFTWDKRRETSFRNLLNMMTDKTYVAPFKEPDRLGDLGQGVWYDYVHTSY